ncbi:type IV secretion protein Rhs [Pedobacter yulinensis]|uniref:Type IV secretion protein Rhs n=1 Tax=Pedobacter yulinensis TaxID=2126353 RepID=A0A2T3HGN9_9SPHI|nr:phage baseplate assembly protein V [Pedobacter yulinensis]PST81592.1 type IV secretion protein Rhs [Pedobacter yulinensis]
MERKLIVEINIEDTPVLNYSSFRLSQEFNAHHTFELVLYNDRVGEPGLISLNESRQFIGKPVSVSFGYSQDQMQDFKGLVTGVRLSQTHGFHGNVIVTGFSSSILIDRGEDLGSYLNKTLDDIVKIATRETPENDLRIVSNASRKAPLDYVIQYRESDFEFLNRLSAEYHEWFFYDGQQLCFGRPDQQQEVRLFYGRDLNSLDYGIAVAPIKHKKFAYNPGQDQMLESESPGQADGQPDLVHAVRASNAMYSKVFTQPTAIRVASNSEIREHVANDEKAHVSGLLQVNAAGTNPMVGIGKVIDVAMSVRRELSFQTEDLGKFLVTSIHHHIDGTGKYSNSFQAVVASTERLLVKDKKRPRPDMQLANVVDNNDPQGQGRVKVQFKWATQNNEPTEWLRVMAPDAGSSDKVGTNRGMVSVPETGDQVVVAFEEGNIARPIVMGSVFHGKSGGGGGSGNNNKSLTSKSGNTVKLDDGAGVTVQDKDGNVISLDGAGNALFETSQTIVIKCGESSLSMDMSGNIIIKGKNITVQGENIGHSATSALGMGVGPEGGAPTSGIAIEATTLDIATETLAVSGSSEANFASDTINIGATSNANVSSGTIKLN